MNQYQNAVSATSTGYAAMTAPTAQLLTLERMKDRAGGLHRVLDLLHGIADRMVGIHETPKGLAPSPVPNGLLDEVESEMNAIQDRIDALYARMSHIA